MTYPVWITPAGDLGKIAENEYYALTVLAEDPNGINEVTYKLIAGRLPSGIRLTNTGNIVGQASDVFALVSGVPLAVNEDRDYKFTIRALLNNDPNLVADRTFILTITGNRAPELVTPGVSLGNFLDGAQISIKLDAVDADFDTISWKIVAGELPTGLTLDQTGAIKGVIVPFVQLPESATTGWDNSRWENYPWEFRTRSINKNYSFTVEVSDGKEYRTREYTINVISKSSLTADNIVITADSTLARASNDELREPVIITEDLGIYSSVKSDNYFAFKFEALDYDGDAISWTIISDGIEGFDAIGSTFDTSLFDKGATNLPPGFVLNEATGWLTGYIPAQVASSKTYTFAIRAYKTNNPDYASPFKFFTIKILGSLGLDINWISPKDLGSVYAGEISRILIQATTSSSQNLNYTLKLGSKLPAGLKLLNDGTLSGRLSFQSFSLDGGTTLFDQELLAKGFIEGETVFDRTYKFTVVATNATKSIEGEKEFTLQVLNLTYAPYENVYIKCLPEVSARDKFIQIINNTDVIPTESLYRSNDPYYGRQQSIKFLSAYGLTASEASEYISAMQKRHYNKKLYFGNYGTSIARDNNDNILYEALWIDLIEDTRAYKNNIKQPVPNKEYDIRTRIDKWQNPNFAANDPQGYTIKINDEQLMRRDLIDELGRTNPSVLPPWMTSLQEDKSIPGFSTKAVIAYLKPGEGKKVLFRLHRAIKNNQIPDIKDIPFIADRYILDNNLSQFYDLDTQKFITRSYTTFDNVLRIPGEIVPVATVDFAVEIPFELINGRTTQQVEALGGLDGIITSFTDKLIVFAQQEKYFGYTYDQSVDGWIRHINLFDDNEKFDNVSFDKGEIIPGYVEAGGNPNIVNQRAGIWKITRSSNNIINLEFQREILLGQTLNVRFGTTYGGNKIIYDPASIAETGFVPRYTKLSVDVPTEQVPTTFDFNSTKFVNGIDSYSLPEAGDKYLKFPKVGVFN
jgi:hypothetical protein